MNRSSKSLVPIIALSFAVLLVAALSWKIISAPDDLASDQAAQDQNPAPRLGKAAPPVIWKNTAPAERSAAVASIRGQLDACKNGQWHKAVSYQSTNLKRSFDSTDAFRSMIEGSYPHFANFKSVKFGGSALAGSKSGNRRRTHRKRWHESKRAL
jgi:hypothetical protein